jgi:Ca2+-binding EF-hand superfamily protein
MTMLDSSFSGASSLPTADYDRMVGNVFTSLFEGKAASDEKGLSSQEVIDRITGKSAGSSDGKEHLPAPAAPKPDASVPPEAPSPYDDASVEEGMSESDVITALTGQEPEEVEEAVTEEAPEGSVNVDELLDAVIPEQTDSGEPIDPLQWLMDLLDTDGDGKVTENEVDNFIGLMDEDGDGKLSREEMDTGLTAADADGDGNITVEEFQDYRGETSLRNAIDADGDGEISESEARDFFAKADMDASGVITEEEFHDFFSAMDSDGNGEITAKEYGDFELEEA